MKRLFLVLLALSIAVSCTGINAIALQESAASFDIVPINHYLPPASHEPLMINITTPAAVDSGTLIIAFYTDDKITTIKTMDASVSTKLDTIALELSNSKEDGLPATPDKIRLFTWDKGRLKPLAKASDNMLTPDVVSAANRLIEINILDYLLGINKTNIINLLEGEFDDVKDDKVILLLDAMRKCANDAYSKKETQLLTSEYGRRMYRDEIETVINNLKSDEAQLEHLKDVYGNRASRFGSGKGKMVGNTIKRLLNYLKIDMENFLE